MKKTTAETARCFVIVEPDPIVSLDLSGILGTAFKDAALMICRDFAEAEQYITDAVSSVCVLLNSNMAASGILPLLRDLVARGGEVMFIGDAHDVDFPAYFVQKPFTSEMILTSLTGRMQGN
jgi:hypothetical protein